MALCAAALATALSLHRALGATHSSMGLAGALYAAYLALLLVLGVALPLYPGCSSPEHFQALRPTWSSSVSMVPETLVFGHILGGPGLLLIGLAQKLTSPVLLPRLQRGG